MNAPQDPRSLLLARLGSLVGCARAEGYACITARHEHGAHAVDIDHPCIAIVLRGRKQVRTHAQALEFAPGDLFLIARRCRMDVTNIPDPDSGLYLTVTIPLCEEVLAAPRACCGPIRSAAAAMISPAWTAPSSPPICSTGWPHCRPAGTPKRGWRWPR